MSLPSLDLAVKRSLGQISTYDYDSYQRRRWLCRLLLRTIAFTALAKIDRVEGLENIPQDGSAIIMMNHIAFIDPIVMVQVVPRDIVPLAKEEAYKYPIVGMFPRLWGVIPVKREGFDRRAVKQALDVLRIGEILLVAPEGTRNPALGETREGAAYLASRGNAPIIPTVLEGTEGFPSFPLASRWKKPGARVRFGRPFRFHPYLGAAKGTQLRKMLDEAMYILATMLPEHRRGMYWDLSKATQDTIEWLSE